mgnify:CR=1 FL=1
MAVALQRARIPQASKPADAAEHFGAVRAGHGLLHELDREVTGSGVDAGRSIAG